jgi:hypothetical protein
MNRRKPMTSSNTTDPLPLPDQNCQSGQNQSLATMIPAEAILSLFQSASAWELVEHESRRWLDEMILDSNDNDAPQQLKDNAAAVRQYLGVDDDGPITRLHHRKFASRFEQYLLENTAPSKAIARVFAEFKKWLVTIYKAVDQSGCPITRDLRDWYVRALSLGDPEKVVIVPDRRASPASPTPQPAGETRLLNTPANQILYFADSKRRGCGATVRLESGEPCLLSIAQSGVLVKKSRYGIFGAILYNEKTVYTNSLCGIALAYLFPEKLFPDGVVNPNLRSFLNAILHCHSASEVCSTLNEAIETAEKKAGRRLKELSMCDLPSWAWPPTST